MYRISCLGSCTAFFSVHSRNSDKKLNSQEFRIKIIFKLQKKDLFKVAASSKVIIYILNNKLK